MGVYCVITADIIDSRKFGNIESSLKPKLEEIKSPFLLTPFSISRGDEIQAVCHEANALPVLIRHLRFYCRPCQLRIGLGIGSLDNSGNSANSWEMSGEAFFRARQALERLGKTKKPVTCLIGDDSRFETAFNTIYQLLDLIVTEWTEDQWRAVMTYEQDETQLKAAARLHVTRQNIQKLCHTAKWEQIRITEANVASLLRNQFPGSQY